MKLAFSSSSCPYSLIQRRRSRPIVSLKTNNRFFAVSVILLAVIATVTHFPIASSFRGSSLCGSSCDRANRRRSGTAFFSGLSGFGLHATAQQEKDTIQQDKNTDMKDSVSPYSAAQMKEALEAFYVSSSADDADIDADSDCAHIFGYGDPSHKLSALQTISATRLLDYEALLSDKTSSSSTVPPTEAALLEQAAEFAAENGPTLDLQRVIQNQSPRMALAAEFKRASPSKGVMAPPGTLAGDQAVRYFSAGANIISVLTEPHWFKGSLEGDMTAARLETTAAAATANKERPAILRKDFVMNEYMIAEAAAAGADTVLLIAAILPANQLKKLIEYCRNVAHMEPLVEVHAPEELEVALTAGARVLGVNNRNLHTFQMDLSNTERVAERLTEAGLTFDHNTIKEESASSSICLCALSGMSTAWDVDRYRSAGVGMCLIGESLMRAANPVQAIESLCLHPADFKKLQEDDSAGVSGGSVAAYTSGTQLVKVCGIGTVEDALAACRAGANLIGIIFVEKSPRFTTIEKAKEIVQAVRSFGERTDSISLDCDASSSSSTPPLLHLRKTYQALVRATAAGRRPGVVGVFQNHDRAFVKETAVAVGLDFVQLHGKEGMEAANAAVTGVPTIRVVDINVDRTKNSDASDGISDKKVIVDAILDSLTADPCAILLDTAIKGADAGGGTGVTFDWSIAGRLQEAGLPVLVAGGLTADNVAECVGGVQPAGVDVSSGVELKSQKGVKDHEAVGSFCRSAKSAAVQASKGF